MIRLLAYAAGAIMAASQAAAHDHWISRGHYIDPVTKQHCCNDTDCKELPQSSVDKIEVWDDGLIVEGMVFRRGQLHKSEDGKWWRCDQRCVFRPVEG